MLKIRALNRDSLSDEDAPVLRKELQEEITLEIYNDALRLEGIREFEKSKELLLKLINENIPQLENQGGLPKSMCTLKFACYLNLGHIFFEENNNIKALENYSIASELDQSDITLWYKIGMLSLKELRFRQSIYAFSKGLDCYDSHWPCLKEIIPLLFAVRDTVNCLFYIGKALELNPDYTKGLVIRKRIYQDNPATRGYYQVLNPEHKYEPPLDVEIDKKEEEKCLAEVQAIIDIINVAEKTVETQPLQTIPLPEALENYTWLALSKCIKSLYEYLHSHEMSILTFVDLDKCMSQAANDQIPNKEPEDEKVSTSLTDNNIEMQDNNITEEKMDVDVEIKRRPSQNSEENGTPVQTDNDDEQQVDEEQEERNEKSKSRGLKRKRDLLSDLRVWGWHSKRKNVRKTKPEKFYTVEDCLNQSLPTNLLRNKIIDTYLQDESMNNTNENNVFLEDKQIDAVLSKQTSGPSESYFGTNKEREDIIRLWNKVKENCDITILVKEYVTELSKLWNVMWPQELISHYIFLHEKYSEFYFNQLTNVHDPENKFDDIRNEVLSILLYAELVLFSCPMNMENDRYLHIGQVQFIETAVALHELDWSQEYCETFSRIVWLRAYIARKEKNFDTAVRYLELIIEKISELENNNSEKFCLYLPNLQKCSCITIEVAEKILKHLHMIKSVACLEELFEREKYNEVAKIVQSTFEPDYGYPTVGKIGRPTQLGMLLHSLWFSDMDECFLWCEECLFESYPHYNRPGPNRPQWEGVVEKCLLMMHEIIKSKGRDVVDIIPDEKKARLAETLARIICKQLYTENTSKIPLNTVAPWMILHHLLVKNEEQGKAEEDSTEDAVPASLSILFSAHEFLGPKGWCLTGQGELLHYILDVLLDREDAYKYERLREKLDIQIEQALFCLYQHPSKKNKISRHLADHNVDPLPLTWEKSFQLYEFYAPEVLPEFNSFKNASITVDLEQLLLRITALVTPECNPSLSVPKIKEYLQGKTDQIPAPVEFPYRIQAIYYLLGDYYFKLKDFVRCVDFFLMDLAINPLRIDSWACLGLSYLNQLEIKLNYCKKMKSEEEFLDRAKYAQVAFTRALSLAPDNITLWIEFATFEYMAHSFCSRYLGHESENMSMEKFTSLEDKKNAFLESSRQSFEKAIALYDTDGNEPDERWLHYYILGKISEKKQSEPKEYLGYYLTASQLLHENNATYPEKILYNSPQHLSVEALELHYRMNASILKYLVLHEGKEISHSIGALFKKSLDSLPINLKLVALKAQKKLKKSTEEPKKTEEVKNVVEDVKEVVPTTSNTDEDMEKISAEKQSEINEECTKTPSGENKPIEEGVATTTRQNNDDKGESESDPPMNQEPVNQEPVNQEPVSQEPVKETTETSTDPKKDENNKDQENITKINKTNEKAAEGEVKVVEEVILVDSEYDVILILSSDDEEEEPGDKNIAHSESKKESDQAVVATDSCAPPKDDSPEDKTSDKIIEFDKTPEKIGETLKDKEMESGPTPMEIDDDDTILPNNADKISEQIASGMDVQLILDKMMEETMNMAAQQPMDDSDTGLDKSIEDNKDNENNEHDKKQKDDGKIGNAKESDAEEKKKCMEESTSSGSSSSSSDSSTSSDSDSDDDSSSITTSLTSEDSSSGNLSKNDISYLVDKCIKGLELCIIRLSKNYKAVYRLVHLFFHYKDKKDLNKCKQLLLGEYKCYENSSIMGLFSDRKNNNFFNGIWRIPSSEIDRPGSLSAHMIRCVTILLRVLTTTGDFKILLDMHFQLRKSPDPDKIYIKDSERLQFSEQAISLCVLILRGNIQSAEKQGSSAMKKLLQDIYKVYLRIQKYAPEKDSQFGNMLVDLYKLFVKEKVPDNVNMLDLATKFCQQLKVAEKQQSLNTSLNVTTQSALTPTGTVLPSPTNVNPGTSLKRPSGSSRPRGRPPLPKTSNQQQKQSRNTSKSSSSWKKNSPEPLLSQEYLKHYNEVLMKQYNQNLFQSNQLAQLYSNPYLSSYIQAQQANLLNSTFLQQLSGIDCNSKQYQEVMEMLRKFTGMPKKEPKKHKIPDTGMLSKGEQPAKKQRLSSGGLSDPSSNRGEPPVKKQKLSSDAVATTSGVVGSNKLPTAKVDTTPSVSILPVQNKDKMLSGSCVSSISIISKGGDAHSKPDSAGKIGKTSANPAKKPETTTEPSCSVIMPPPPALSLMMPPPGTKLSSPRRSPTGIKEPAKLKNIEATISRVSSDTFKKPAPQLSSLALEAGLVKFPASLSMTPVVPSQKSSAEFHQSLQRSIPNDTYIPKLPSSITLTPSTLSPKLAASGLEVYKRPYSVDQPKELKKRVSSPSGHHSKTTTAYPNKSHPTLPAGIDLQLAKSKGAQQSKKTDPIPFNVDSMLQSTSSKLKAATAVHSYAGFQQHLAPQVAHTSVITSTNMSSPSTALYPQPTKSTQGYPKKTAGSQRNPDLYKVDEPRPYDIPLGNMYTAPRQDVAKGSTSVITGINKSSSPVSYPSPQISPGKTLQEELADKKREQASKHLFEQMGHQKPVAPKTGIVPNYGNPHSVSKILSKPSSSETANQKVTAASIYSSVSANPSTYIYPNVPVKPSAPRRKSSSDESVVFLD